MRSAMARLTRLVDDLQRVSRAEERQLELRLERIAPHELTAASVAASAPAYASKGVSLTSDVGQQLPVVAVDSDRLGEVLANLLDNALRHTPAGGHVRIDGRVVDDRVELAVADTGEGIAPEHLQRIFERFYRADAARARSSGGSGIGLAIARALVEAHVPDPPGDRSLSARSTKAGVVPRSPSVRARAVRRRHRDPDASPQTRL